VLQLHNYTIKYNKTEGTTIAAKMMMHLHSRKTVGLEVTIKNQ